MRRLVMLLTAAVSLIASQQPAGAEITLRLRDTVTLPEGFTGIAGFTDMDGDKTTDLVVWKWGAGGAMKILEPDKDGVWTQRFIFKPQTCRCAVVADVDGDGRPEVLAADQNTVVIYEATGDNQYKLMHKSTGYRKIELIKTGDSNGDGKIEFLVPQEGSRVHMLESTADNCYKILGPLTGRGSDSDLVGTFDLDGDGEPSLMFHDISGSTGRTYVYKKGQRVFESATIVARDLGDTDGNGRQEMIGGSKIPKNLDDLVIVESLGDNRFKEVLKLPNWWDRDSRIGVQDVDGDGRAELLRRLPGPNGANNVLSVSTRDGQQIKEVFNSGTLFHDQDANLVRVIAIDDTNGDGNRELLIVQGTKLYFVEVVVEKES